jgi:hypothetical protein
MEVLPSPGGRPYLSAFALTHADQDHCQGFAELLESVDIGELWATPRLWREYQDTDAVICEDARAFQEEAERRVEATRAAVERGEKPKSGDRILVVGYDTDRDRHAYSDLPAEYLTGPGHKITSLDGDDVSAHFEAFVHAPFKDDCAAARNETSLALQVTLHDDNGASGHALLLGDLAHPTIMKIFTFSEEHNRPERLAWDVLLAPHHCSKYVMYADGEFQQDVMDAFERHARENATVVASSSPVPLGNQSGDNPPHAKAKSRYLGILPTAARFVCTQEWPDEDDPHPVAFALTANGLTLLDPTTVDRAAATVENLSKATTCSPQDVGVLVALAATPLVVAGIRRWSERRAATKRPTPKSGLDRAQQAIDSARGQATPPRQRVGFGRR